MTIFINSFELDIGNDHLASAFVWWLSKRYLGTFGQPGHTLKKKMNCCNKIICNDTKYQPNQMASSI